LAQSSKPAGGLFELIERGLDVAERFEQLGPLGAGALAWEALPQATKERVLGECCSDCGAPHSLCECCDRCGWTPCACPEKFPRDTIEAEGVAVE
jgi:hypothetical protein